MPKSGLYVVGLISLFIILCAVMLPVSGATIDPEQQYLNNITAAQNKIIAADLATQQAIIDAQNQINWVTPWLANTTASVNSAHSANLAAQQAAIDAQNQINWVKPWLTATQASVSSTYSTDLATQQAIINAQASWRKTFYSSLPV